MIIENKRDGVIVVPVGKGGEKGTVILLPGNNEVPDEVWDEAKGNVDSKHIKILNNIIAEVATKTVKVKEGSGKSVEKTEAKQFNELSPAEAEELIKNTFNLETLETWKNNSTDESIRLILLKKIEEVESFGEDKKKGKKK